MGLYTALSARPACSSTSSRVSLLARGIVPISVQSPEVSASRTKLWSIGSGAGNAVGAGTQVAVGLEREGAERAVAAPGADDLFAATSELPGTGGIEDDAQDFAFDLVVIGVGRLAGLGVGLGEFEAFDDELVFDRVPAQAHGADTELRFDGDVEPGVEIGRASCRDRVRGEGCGAAVR